MSVRRYPAYKDSGINWLGKVPTHWDIRRLKRTCDVFPSNVDKKSYDGEAPVRLCNYTDVYYNETITDGLDFMAATASPEQVAKFTLRAGDTIITKDSETADDIAIGAYVPKDLPGVICGYHLSLVRPNDGTNGAFVKRLFDSIYAKSCFAVLANGLTRVGLGQYELDNIELPFPPPAEQCAIAVFLDRETGKIDALIAEQNRLAMLLKEEIESLVLSSRNTKEMRLAQAATIVSRPVTQRKGENYEAIGLFNRGRGLFHKDARDAMDMGDSDFFWVEAGDLIISGQFAWEGAIAMADIEDHGCVVSHRYPILRGREGVAITEYLFALLSTMHGDFLLNESSRGSAGRNRPLNIDLLLKEKIMLADMERQELVAKRVRERRYIVKEISKQTMLLKERRVALISAAVTGKIDVRSLAAPQSEAA